MHLYPTPHLNFYYRSVLKVPSHNTIKQEKRGDAHNPLTPSFLIHWGTEISDKD